jgi:hypothetical protein
MVLVEAVGEVGVKVVVPVGIAASLRIDRHLLDSPNGAEGLLNLFE